MTKGDRTRETILDRAVEMASVSGLGGLSIGGLARDLGMSKSGLFVHFGSKEALQAAVIEAGGAKFYDVVIAPARAAKPGLERLKALFDNWLRWVAAGSLPGGCLLLGSASELDDRPGPARDELVAAMRFWDDLLARWAERAKGNGEFRADLDSRQFAHEFVALMLGYHHAQRLLRSRDAERRTRTAFLRLITASRRQPA